MRKRRFIVLLVVTFLIFHLSPFIVVAKEADSLDNEEGNAALDNEKETKTDTVTDVEENSDTNQGSDENTESDFEDEQKGEDLPESDGDSDPNSPDVNNEE